MVTLADADKSLYLIARSNFHDSRKKLRLIHNDGERWNYDDLLIGLRENREKRLRLLESRKIIDLDLSSFLSECMDE